MTSESTLLLDRNILVCLDSHFSDPDNNLKFLKDNFCGKVITDLQKMESCSSRSSDDVSNTLVFLTGNISQLVNLNIIEIIKKGKLIVVKDFSHSYSNDGEESKEYTVITWGQVPINVNNVGVYFREAYDCKRNYYGLITDEHKFQNLTESNKPGQAFRKGIYITQVTSISKETKETKDEEQKYKFRLLRCSSNFTGPTDNVRETDQYIIEETNRLASSVFNGGAELNHVLAQTYENKYTENDKGKKLEKKAVISAHSDKTKDMPRNGLMAFCTFYKDYDATTKSFPGLKDVKKSTTDPFDFCYKNQTVLTKLRFRLKTVVAERLDNLERLDKSDQSLVKQFDVTLYPNSIYLMSLSANRLYTHEIIPSILQIEKLPTRLGYVIRCSKTIAIHENGTTHILDVNGDGDESKLIKLEPATQEGFKKVRDLYSKENSTDEMIDYGMINFSMNAGDYKLPCI